MSIFVVWVDREHAKVFQFSNEKMERKSLTASHTDHQRQTKAFFTQLTDHLTQASRILILGPGVAKHHFQTYLIEHFPVLAKKIAGCETVEHPTDDQIAAIARKFLCIPTPL